MKPPRSSARQRSHDTPRSPRPWLSSRGRFQTPRCDGSTPSRTSSTGTSRPSRASGCAPPCREGVASHAAGACRRVLFDGGGRDQVDQLQRVAGCGGAGARGPGGDPRPDSRGARPLELARGAGGRGLRGRGAAVRVREQADHGGQHRIPAGDEPAVRGRARAMAVARARARSGPRVHGCPGRRPGAAVRRRAATLRDRAGPLPRQRAGGGERAGMGVHGHGVPLAGPPRRGPRPDRGRGSVRQPVRVSGVPAGGAPARGWACHRLADRGLSRRVSTRPRLRVPVARHHPGTGTRGLAVPFGRAGAESGVGLARARRDAGPARDSRRSRHPDGDGPQSLDRQPNGGGVRSSAVIRTYYIITGLFNLAMSLIWGIDTLFKMSAGLDIQQVLLTNAAFTVGSMVFEVPTGVVADTLGRRVSLLLCLRTLFVTTLLYVTIAWRGWGFSAFVWVSVLLGLGYTFYTGAVDAWLVDALKATGYTEPLERVFSRGQMLFGAAMLAGTIGGGAFGPSRRGIPDVGGGALVVPLV